MKKWLYLVEELFLIVLFLIAFFSLTAQIISRNFFDISIVWSEELARIIFLWIVFMGSAYCVRVSGHIAIDFFIKKLPNTLYKYTLIAINIISATFLFILSYFGISLALKLYNLPTIALEISSFWLYLAVPLGSFLMGLRYLSQILDIIKNGVEPTNSSTLL